MFCMSALDSHACARASQASWCCLYTLPLSMLVEFQLTVSPEKLLVIAGFGAFIIAPVELVLVMAPAPLLVVLVIPPTLVVVVAPPSVTRPVSSPLVLLRQLF